MTLIMMARRAAILEGLRAGDKVTASALAALAGTSERTVYRYIEALRKQGYNIAGEAGYGYVMMKQKTPSMKRVREAVLAEGGSPALADALEGLVNQGKVTLYQRESGEFVVRVLPEKAQEKRLSVSNG